jgi:hypothetical protein
MIDCLLQAQDQLVLFQDHRKVDQPIWLSRAGERQRRDVELREREQVLKRGLVRFAKRGVKVCQLFLVIADQLGRGFVGASYFCLLSRRSIRR